MVYFSVLIGCYLSEVEEKIIISVERDTLRPDNQGMETDQFRNRELLERKHDDTNLAEVEQILELEQRNLQQRVTVSMSFD